MDTRLEMSQTNLENHIETHFKVEGKPSEKHLGNHSKV